MTSPLKRAYFGMQCFWGVESSFAKLHGVKKTRVGYAGGTTINPTYRNIGDHTEITEIQYEENVTSFHDLLEWFFSHHNPVVHNKKQYQSAVLFVDDEQRALSEEALDRIQKKFGRKPDTYVTKLDRFYQAEDYHQKYWLRCRQDVYRQLKLSDPELVDSTLAAKVNAFLAGYDDSEVLHKLADEHSLPPSLVETIKEIVRSGGDPRACH